MTEQKTDQTTSQPQNPMHFFQETFETQIDRLDDWCETMDEWQREGFERTEQAIDEVADASKDTLEYVERLTEEWRKTSMETLRHMNDQLDADQ